MIPHRFYSQLLVLGLLWRFMMLSLAWPSSSGPSSTEARYAQPVTPQTLQGAQTVCWPDAQAPCPLCDPHPTSPRPPSPRPPAPRPPPTRRPRAIAPSMPLCPQSGGAYRGWLRRGNLRANGHPRGGPWRQCQCPACTGSLLAHHGTILHGKRVAMAVRGRGRAGWAEGSGMPATARVCEGDPKTVLQGVVEAAEPLQAFARSVLCAVHRRQGQRDALSAVRRAVQDGARGADEALQRRARSPPGVWTAMDPDNTRRLVIAVGPRSVARAQRGVPQGVQGWTPDGVPLLLPDGSQDSGTALLRHWGGGPSRNASRGRARRQNLDGCHCPRGARRRSSQPCAGDAWYGDAIA